MKPPADMLLLRERQRKLQRPANESNNVYYRAFSRVMLFGTIVRGHVDHDRLQAALVCEDESEPGRHPAMRVTLYPDDRAALQNAAAGVVRAAHLADAMHEAAADVNEALRAYRAAALRNAWAQALGTSPARDDLDRAGVALVALLKDL